MTGLGGPAHLVEMDGKQPIQCSNGGGQAFSVETELPIPMTESWHLRMEELMEARRKSLWGTRIERSTCARGSLCSALGFPSDKVEDASHLVVTNLGFVYCVCVKTGSTPMNSRVRSYFTRRTLASLYVVHPC